MNDNQFKLFSLLQRLPPRLTRQQTAHLLNCQDHDIPILVAAKLLKPLGNPPVNGAKYFCTEFVLERCKDVAWLARVTNSIHDYWRRKNAAKEKKPPTSPGRCMTPGGEDNEPVS